MHGYGVFGAGLTGIMSGEGRVPNPILTLPGRRGSIYNVMLTRGSGELVLGGEDDPMHPIESQADIAAALPAHLVQFERFDNCGHGVVPDAPERAMAVIRDFIER